MTTNPPLVKISALPPCRRRLPLYRVRWLKDRERPRDRCGRIRNPITFPEYHRGRRPGNFGKRYPADPPSADEVLAILAACPTNTRAGRRLRALIVLLWQSGLRCQEALDLLPSDLDPASGTVRVRRGKGGKARLSGMCAGAFEEVMPWVEERAELPPGPLFSVTDGPTKGGPLRSAYVRAALHALERKAGVTKSVRPHSLRHAHAVELARENTRVDVISKQLGHSNLATTTTYLAGIAPVEVINTIHARQWPGAET